MSTAGNHRSHWASSPGAYSVRCTGSGGTNNRRNSATRSFSWVIDRSHPMRSAITVAGILGCSASNARIAGSNASTAHALGARS
jgi:hypothetical protein